MNILLRMGGDNDLQRYIGQYWARGALYYPPKEVCPLFFCKLSSRKVVCSSSGEYSQFPKKMQSSFENCCESQIFLVA